MSWNGTERRKPSSDHDTLIELVVILNNHVTNFNKHVEDDKVLEKDIRFATRMIFLALGGLGMLDIIVNIVKH